MIDPLAQLLGFAPQALLLDLDGTLVDSAPDLARSVDAMLTERDLPAAGEERVRRWVGNGAPMLVARALAWARGEPEPDAGVSADDTALGVFFAHYACGLCRCSRLYLGVETALSYWARQGLALACVTNKPERFTSPLLAALGLERWLAVVVSGDTLALKKPEPAPLLEACRRLGVDPARAVVVGDSRTDVLAARAAGMPVVAVSYGYNHACPVGAEQPDRVVDDLRELLPPEQL